LPSIIKLEKGKRDWVKKRSASSSSREGGEGRGPPKKGKRFADRRMPQREKKGVKNFKPERGVVAHKKRGKRRGQTTILISEGEGGGSQARRRGGGKGKQY